MGSEMCIRDSFTVKQLKEADLGDVFIDYMRNWKGFVEDGR